MTVRAHVRQGDHSLPPAGTMIRLRKSVLLRKIAPTSLQQSLTFTLVHALSLPFPSRNVSKTFSQSPDFPASLAHLQTLEAPVCAARRPPASPPCSTPAPSPSLSLSLSSTPAHSLTLSLHSVSLFLSRSRSTVNSQLSTLNSQLSTVNCQLSTVNCEL